MFSTPLRPKFLHVTKDQSFDFPMRDKDVGRASEINFLRAFIAGQVIYNHSGVKVVCISKSVIIKAGPEVISRDAEVLKLVRPKVRHVKLPKIYRYFSGSCPADYGAYVVMECIHGVSLGDGEWKELSPRMPLSVFVFSTFQAQPKVLSRTRR